MSLVRDERVAHTDQRNLYADDHVWPIDLVMGLQARGGGYITVLGSAEVDAWGVVCSEALPRRDRLPVRTLPYTLRGFIELAESENRRGRDISRYDAGVARANRALRDARKRHLAELGRASDDEQERSAIRDSYSEVRHDLVRQRDLAVETALHSALTSFENKLTKDAFSFGLIPGPHVAGKATYQVSSTLDVTFPAKQAADAVKRAAGIDAPSRNSIIRALQTALSKRYQHVIYKVDVKEFFESVDHETLVDRLATHPALDSVTVSLVRRLLAEYETFSPGRTGLPRGVGLSSALAELYLNHFDSKVKTHPGVLFYARYVDDMVIVLENEVALNKVKNEMSSELATLKLELNDAKTLELITLKDGNYPGGKEVEYLGYRIGCSADKLTTGLTEKRKQRRIQRLETAIQHWLDTAPNAVWPNHGHNGLLIDRIRYLAGNTKLINSKSNVAIGLYFSNSALDVDAHELVELDLMLNEFCKLHASKLTPKMRERIERISFVEMFASREYLRFRQKRVEEIVGIWKGNRK